MGFLAAIPAIIGQAAASAAATIGTGLSSVGTALSGTAGAAGGASSGLAGGLAKVGSAASAIGGIATAANLLSGGPKPPGVPAPPVAPSFGAGLSGGNRSLASQNPLAALGGTNTGNFAAPLGGGKTLLGQ